MRISDLLPRDEPARPERRHGRLPPDADREREHALFGVAVVGDDAPAHGVVAVAEVRLQRDRERSRRLTNGRPPITSAPSSLRIALLRVPTRTGSSNVTSTTVGAFDEHGPVRRVAAERIACDQAAGAATERQRADEKEAALHVSARVAPPITSASLARPMPIYEYKCPNGHLFEVFHGMTEPSPDGCEVCGAEPLQRVLHPVAVHYKGSGFYSTDYGKGGAQEAKRRRRRFRRERLVVVGRRPSVVVGQLLVGTAARRREGRTRQRRQQRGRLGRRDCGSAASAAGGP